MNRRPGGRRTRRNGRIARSDSKLGPPGPAPDGTDLRGGGGLAVRRRGSARTTKPVSPSGPRGFPARLRGGRPIEVEADGAVGPERDLQNPTRDILPLQADQGVLEQPRLLFGTQIRRRSARQPNDLLLTIPRPDATVTNRSTYLTELFFEQFVVRNDIQQLAGISSELQRTQALRHKRRAQSHPRRPAGCQ